MDEREQRILQTYEDFKHYGVVKDEADEPVDALTAQQVLRGKVAEFERNIADAYDSKARRTTCMTKAALLSVMIEGGTDDEIREFMRENRLSAGISIEHRRDEAIRMMKSVEAKAEQVRKFTDGRGELNVDEESYRSLDDTLVEILNRGGLTAAEQGSLRLLFDLVAVPGTDQKTRTIVAHMKVNAMSLLRTKLDSLHEASAPSHRAAEGERLLLLLTSRTRAGYPTISSLADTFAHDKESRAKVPYGTDSERNLRMIETYVSSALDVMYPTADPDLTE